MNASIDIWKLIAGLGLFLYGTMRMEKALRQLSGRPFKLFLRRHTGNLFKAVLGGVLVTAMLQSSSVVSLMVLAFVGAGIISFRNALGVVLGANLGSTFVNWIVATVGFHFDIESIALPVLAVASTGMFFFSERRALYNLLKLFLGFSLMFLGLGFIQEAAELAVKRFDISGYVEYGTWAFVLIGLVITVIIQTSSATVAIALTALNAGVIDLTGAAAVVIGSEVGTTVKLVLSGMKGNVDKKRLAAANFSFNVLTSILAWIFLQPLIAFVTKVLHISDPLIGLVMFQTVVNFGIILLLLPLMKWFADFLEKRFSRDATDGSLLTRDLLAMPEPAIDLLRQEAENLLRHAMGYVHLALDTERRNSDEGFSAMLRNLVKTSGKSNEAYERLKQTEGQLLEFYVRLEEQELNQKTRAQLSQYLGAVRQAVHAAKEVKDVRHNIKEFNDSANDRLHEWKRRLQDEWIEFDSEFARLQEEPDDERMLQLLGETMKKAYEEQQRNHSEVLKALSEKEINELEASTVMNVLRDMLSAKRALLRAAAYLRLPPEKADAFEYSPPVSTG